MERNRFRNIPCFYRGVERPSFFQFHEIVQMPGKAVMNPGLALCTIDMNRCRLLPEYSAKLHDTRTGGRKRDIWDVFLHVASELMYGAWLPGRTRPKLQHHPGQCIAGSSDHGCIVDKDAFVGHAAGGSSQFFKSLLKDGVCLIANPSRKKLLAD